MRKEIITVKIAVHPLQKKIIDGLQSGKIDLGEDTLRGIAKKIGWKEAPAQIKNHLEALVKLGAIQKMYGQYVFIK